MLSLANLIAKKILKKSYNIFMISNLQKPIDSGFHAKSNSNDIVQNIDLVGKKAIITGGYSGIGLETTKSLVNAGAEVFIPAKRTWS